MNRRPVLLLASAGVMVGVVTIAATSGSGRLELLDRAAKAKMPAPPVAVLVELGVTDKQPAPWSGKATVRGAAVAHREGYKFRSDDKLVGADAWEASSHRPLRGPRNNAAANAMEGMASVGVVLHLADVTADAVLMIEPKG